MTNSFLGSGFLKSKDYFVLILFLSVEIILTGSLSYFYVIIMFIALFLNISGFPTIDLETILLLVYFGPILGSSSQTLRLSGS